VGASAAAAETASTTAAAGGLGTGFIDIEGAPIQFSTIEGGDCTLGLGIIRHFDEGEPARAAGIAIGNDIDTFYVPVGLEERTDGRFGGGKSQIADEYILHLAILSVFDGASRERNRLELAGLGQDNQKTSSA